MMKVWTEEQIRGLGTRTDLVTACEIVYGCGRTKAFELFHRGELDFPALRRGRRIICPTQPILEILGLARTTKDDGHGDHRPRDAA